MTSALGKLLIFKQILLTNIIGIAQKNVRRLCILTLGCEGLRH